MKRMLICLAVMLLLTFGVCAEVIGGSCGENAGWYLDTETGVLYLVGKGDMQDYSYSAIVEDKLPWYPYRAFIKKVEIGEGITSIGDYSFYDCKHLSEVIIPETVTKIGASAFCNCERLHTIDIPKSVVTIGNRAFMSTGLFSVKLPEGIKHLDTRTFFIGHYLREITIPDSVTNIHHFVFGGNTNTVIHCGNRSFAKFFAIVNGNNVAVNDGNSDITIYVDGECLNFDVKPYIKNGRTMVPFRAIFEALGAEVEWVEEKQTVNALWDEIPLSLTIGSNIMIRKNKEYVLDVPPEIVDGRTMVPVRAISEAFRCEVLWHEATSTVIIKTENYDDVMQARIDEIGKICLRES